MEIAFPSPHIPRRFTNSYFCTNTGPPSPIQLQKKQKKKTDFLQLFFVIFFSFFFPVEKPFRSNGPIGEMADWRRFARVTIIYYIGYDRAQPKIKPDIVYLQHAVCGSFDKFYFFYVSIKTTYALCITFFIIYFYLHS